MRQTAHVKEVQRIGGVIGSSDVSIGPGCSLLQVEERIGARQSSRETSTRKREVKLSCSEFEVIAPFRFRVETERRGSQQVAAGRGICQIKDMLGGKQTFIGVSWIAGFEYLEAFGQACSHASRKVRTDQGACSSGSIDEYRPVADKADVERASLPGIICLGKPPDIVIADGLRISIANADLVIKGF